MAPAEGGRESDAFRKGPEPPMREPSIREPPIMERTRRALSPGRSGRSNTHSRDARTGSPGGHWPDRFQTRCPPYDFTCTLLVVAGCLDESVAPFANDRGMLFCNVRWRRVPAAERLVEAHTKAIDLSLGRGSAERQPGGAAANRPKRKPGTKALPQPVTTALSLGRTWHRGAAACRPPHLTRS